MVRSSSSTALLGALLVAAPLDGAAAQMAQDFTLRAAPNQQAGAQLSRRPRVDPLRFRDDAFEEPFDLFGIPLSLRPATATRERGLSFAVRPVKGVRAVARLRF